MNAANGNLLINRSDEFLVGLGPDVAISRTYNSLGDLSDENSDNWRYSTDRRIYTIDSTHVKRVSSDGSEITYTLQGGVYVATDSAGAYDTLTYSASTNEWTWTDGDTQIHETYAANGNYWLITKQYDDDGNQLNWSFYGNGSLYRVTTQDGAYIQYNWDASYTHINEVVTGYTDLATSTAKTLTRTSYSYDGQNRLSAVTVDLNPEVSGTADGKIYTTTYTYDGTSTRVASISQTDGSRIDITYDASNRVQTIAQTAITGVTRITSVSYGTDASNNKVTTITDPLGLQVELTSDATTGNLLKIKLPPATTGATQQVTQFAYNGNGDVLTATDALGNATTYANHVNGLAGTITDKHYNVTTRTFNGANQLLTETTTASDAESAAASHTVKYAYDGENHLRYRVSAEGYVTEYRYDAVGTVEKIVEYPEAQYAGVVSESEITTWLRGLTDKNWAKVVSNIYDARGNLISSTRYSGALNDAQGDAYGDAAAGYSKSFFTYDQAGNLLNRHENNRNTETFVYDGMGRLLSAVDVNGGTTSYVFDDANTRTIVTLASGLVQTSTYNKAGELVSYTEATEPNFIKNELLLNATDGWRLTNANRVNGPSNLLPFVYQQVSTASDAYVDTGTLQDVPSATNLTLSFTVKAGVAGQQFQAGVYWYDAAGNFISASVVDRFPTSTTSFTTYDVAITRPANAAKFLAYQIAVRNSGVGQMGGLKLTAQVTAGSSAAATDIFRYDPNGRLRMSTDALGNSTYYLYDNVGRKVAEISPAGEMIEYKYDANNRLVATVTYATLVPPAQLVTLNNPDVAADVANFRPIANNNVVEGDVWTWRVYDKEGRILQTIDGLGFTTINTYDGAGRLVKSVGYANNIASATVTGFKTTPPTIITNPFPLDDANNRVTRTFFDKDGRLVGTLDGLGYVTKFIYDKAGQKIEEIAFKNAPTSANRFTTDTFNQILQAVTVDNANDRHTRYVYNGQGQLRFVVNSLYQVVETQFDNSGQATSVIRYKNALSSSTTDFTFDNIKARVADAGFASSIEDRRSWAVYDGAGRLAYSIDGEGYVSKFAYDASGRVIRTTQFATSRSTPSLPSQATMDSWAGSNAAHLDNRTTRNYYDGAGFLRYVVDGEGYAIRQTKDLEGRITKVERFANALSVTDSTTIDSLQSLVTSSGGTSVETNTTYDADGRVKTVRDAEGGATTYGYDTSDRVIKVTDARGIITYNYYDNANNLIRKCDDATGLKYVTARTYNAFGEVTSETRYYNSASSAPLPETGQLPTPTTHTRDAVTFTYYDVLGRVRKTCDALKYVTETTYTPFGQVATVKRYYNASTNTPGVTAEPVIGTDVILDPVHDATTSFTYDRLGRLKRTTDAEGAYEDYTLNAFGDRTSVLNKLGGTITNKYDRRGFLIEEALPMASVNSAGTQVAATVTNKFSYNAFGNRSQMIEASGLAEQRTTNYEYDKLGRLKKKTLDAVTTTSLNDFTTTTAVTVTTNSGVIPTESYYYDSRGNLIAIDSNGARTISYYDKVGRRTYEVGPLGTLKKWTYDAMGNKLTERVYGDVVAVPTVVQRQASDVPPNAPSTYRETVFTYDLLNRLKTTQVVGALVGTWNGSTGVTTASQDVTSNLSYDAFSNVISSTDARLNSVYSWYDKLGRKTDQVDQEGYLTHWTYDAEGNVLSETRYAIKTSDTPNPLSAVPTVAADANDRITNFTYDRNGRRRTETRTGVDAYTVSTINGALTKTSTSSTIIYTYNGLGQVTSKQEATLDTVNYNYDATGRLIKEWRTAYNDQTGASVTPEVIYSYNGLNNLSRTQQGNKATIEASQTAGRITTYTYGAGGRLAAMTDAAGQTHNYGYDAAGNLVIDRYIREIRTTGGTTVSADEGILYRRDLLGRITTQTIADLLNNVRGDSQNTQYNAHGDVAQRGINGLWQESFTYNNRGLVEKTNTGDGVWRFYVYDQNGNQILAIESEGNDYSNTSLGTSTTSGTLLYSLGSVAGATFVDGVNCSVNVFDKRNQATQAVLTQRELSATGGRVPLITSQTYNAFGEVATQLDAVGNQQPTQAGKDAYTTYFYFNTMGRLTRKVMPQVSILSTANVASTVTPTECYYYDLSGRLIGTADANGFVTDYETTKSNATTRSLLAGTGYNGSEALVTAEYHRDAGIAKTFYDVFGDARTVRDELNRDETRTYDGMGRVTTIVRRTGLKEEFDYDLLGQRLRHRLKDTVNTLLGSESSEYDLQGRVTVSWDLGGDKTTYAYAWNASLTNSGKSGSTIIGGWTKVTTMWAQLGASAKTKSETTDVHGLTTTETDLGGHTVAYTYDRAGRLTQKQGTNGSIVTTLGYTYFNTGLTATVTDSTTGMTANNITSTFAYDAVGRRTAEKYTGTVYRSSNDTSYTALTAMTGQVIQDATITYNALGWMTNFTNKNASAVTDLTVNQYYDAAGNIRRTQTVTYPNLVTGSTAVADKWFTYDAMNRMVIADGIQSVGTITRGTSGQGVSLTYDVAGNRKTATRSIQVYDQELHRYFTEPVVETYTYDADNQLSSMVYNGDSYASSTTTRDIRGRVIEYTEYSGASLSNHRWNIVYNARGQVSSESNFQMISGATDIDSTIANQYDVYGNITRTDNAIIDLKDTWQDWHYAWWDGAVVSYSQYDKETYGSNNLYRTDQYYDGLGRLQRAFIDDGKDRAVHYALNSDDQVVRRFQNDATSNDPQEYHRFVSGRQVAEYTNDKNEDTRDYDYQKLIGDKTSNASGSGRYYHGSTTGTAGGEFGTSGFDPVNQINAGVGQNSRSRYTVQAGDTLQGIAASLWGDSSLWYLIAEANGLSGDAALTAGQGLSIPLHGPSNRNSADMFRPYDTASAVGDLNPTSAKPPKKNKCGVFGQVLLTVIQIAVQIVLTAVLAPVLGPAAPFVAKVGANIITQGIGVATGLQDKFSWKQVGITALTAALSGPSTGNPFLDAAQAAVVNAQVQGIAVATGLQKKFDWAGVAAAGISAGISTAVSNELIGPTNADGKRLDAAGKPMSPEQLAKTATIWNSSRGIGNIVATSAASMIADAATRSVIQGSDFGDNMLAGLPGLVGATVGGMMENAISGLRVFDGQMPRSALPTGGSLAAAGSTAAPNAATSETPNQAWLNAEYEAFLASKIPAAFQEGLGSPLIKDFPRDRPEVSEKVARLAEDWVGSDDWADQSQWVDPVTGGAYEAGTNKCSIFVGFVLARAGAGAGTPNYGGIRWPGEAGSPPTAGQWADPNYDIPGWRVLAKGETPRPGDVVAQRLNYQDATGHVMIVGHGNRFIGTGGQPGSPHGIIVSKPKMQFLGPRELVAGPLVYRRYAK